MMGSRWIPSLQTALNAVEMKVPPLSEITVSGGASADTPCRGPSRPPTGFRWRHGPSEHGTRVSLEHDEAPPLHAVQRKIHHASVNEPKLVRGRWLYRGAAGGLGGILGMDMGDIIIDLPSRAMMRPTVCTEISGLANRPTGETRPHRDAAFASGRRLSSVVTCDLRAGALGSAAFVLQPGKPFGFSDESTGQRWDGRRARRD